MTSQGGSRHGSATIGERRTSARHCMERSGVHTAIWKAPVSGCCSGRPVESGGRRPRRLGRPRGRAARGADHRAVVEAPRKRSGLRAILGFPDQISRCERVEFQCRGHLPARTAAQLRQGNDGRFCGFLGWRRCPDRAHTHNATRMVCVPLGEFRVEPLT